jgi:hypothetical protein
MPLQPTAQNRIRHQQKIQSVLRFLRTSIYSTAPLLGTVMNIPDPWAIRKSLAKMEQRCLLRKAILESPLGKLELWGITQAGQQSCSLLPGEFPNETTFNVSKIGIATLRHYLSLQEIRIKGEQAGWKDFQYCDRTSRTLVAQTDPSQPAIRPDLIAVNPQALKVAIECELSLKAPIRYKRDVIPNHVKQLNAQQYDFVLWLTPTFDDQQTLHQSLRKAMAELQNENKIHIQRTYDSYRMFQFANLQTWPHV